MKKTFKQVPFTHELAMKIQKGEVKGKIETRDGRPAKVLEYLLQGKKDNILAVISTSQGEDPRAIYPDGSYFSDRQHGSGLLLYIEETHKIKPFDRVLVRDEEDEEWKADMFFAYAPENATYKFIGFRAAWKCCIPYEGNEELTGTTDKPKEE